MPKPITVDLPPFTELERLASLGGPATLYEKQIFNELKDGRERDFKVVIHPINEAVFGEQATFATNLQVPSVAQDCETSIQCDMHYELDWLYRLRAEVTCEQAKNEDVCFATTACLCDNGYYKIADTMPKRGAKDFYDGFTEVLNEFQRVEELKN